MAERVAKASTITNKGAYLAIQPCIRTINGPHLYYPNPSGPGGTGTAEDWVMDNFNLDPYARNAMIETAENVAREAYISWEEQNEVTLLRYQQYQEALQDDAAFHRHY